MEKGHITIYYGDGKGKTAVLVGYGIRAVGEGLRVVMLQFMKKDSDKESVQLEKMDPDFRVFRFEKEREGIDIRNPELEEGLRKEIADEIRNTFNFANKIVDTGECELLLLDGVLDCVEYGYLSESDLLEWMERKPENMSFVLTGRNVFAKIAEKSTHIYCVSAEKEV